MKQNIRSLGVILLFMMFFVSCSSKASTMNEDNKIHVNSEKFEILELLVDSPLQARTIHHLLNNNQVVYNNMPIIEWEDTQYGDGLKTDFEFSEGKMVSGTLFEGDLNFARKIYTEADSILHTKYSLDVPLKSKEWVYVNGLPCMQYINFYNLESRRIGIGLYIYSETNDENNASNAQVVISLGGD